uniref:BPTI/Kunitz inhibitor domain-containing protein n=1 Tax=Sinocyclocheilus grahami TaxID=75366 RepID=A0A672LHY0_SINGR
LPRYYYNDGICQPFTFGGCGGNENNYKTEESCMTTYCYKSLCNDNSVCLHRSEETCAAPSDSGPCRAAFQKFYYEPSTQSCKRFIYGGCQGNLNRYSSEEECMATCSGKDGKRTTGILLPVLSMCLCFAGSLCCCMSFSIGRFDGRTRSRWTPGKALLNTYVFLLIFDMRIPKEADMVLKHQTNIQPVIKWILSSFNLYTHTCFQKFKSLGSVKIC